MEQFESTYRLFSSGFFVCLRFFHLLVNKQQKEHKSKYLLCGLCTQLQQRNYKLLLMRWILLQMKYTTRELKNAIKHNKKKKSFETMLLQSFHFFNQNCQFIKIVHLKTNFAGLLLFTDLIIILTISNLKSF